MATNEIPRTALEAAVRLLTQAGAVFSVPEDKRHLSLSSAAVVLDCSPKYLREHLEEFPNRWRMPGGEWRIPARDVEALAAARKFLAKP